MKKKLLILFTLIMVLSIALSITATCFAEDYVEKELEIKPLEVEEETQEVVIEQTADNNATIWFKEIWEKGKAWVIGACSGLSISALVGAFLVVAVKRATNKGFDSIEKNTNATTIADKTSEKFLQNISNVALDVNIKPVLESQYKAMSEEINGELTINLQKQDRKNLALIKCFEAFADYFKCSTAVSDEQKEALAQTIEEAKALYSNCDNQVTAKVEVKAEPEKKETKVSIAENY